MKPENLEKMKQVIKDELGVSDKLAEFCERCLRCCQKSIAYDSGQTVYGGGK